MPEFKDVLRQLRKEQDLTQPILADVLGVSRSAISMYETGAREPDLEILREIADYFDVSMGYLLGRTDDRTNYDDPSVADGIPLEVLEGCGWDVKRALSAMAAADEDAKNSPPPWEQPTAEILDSKNYRMVPLYDSVAAGFGVCANSVVVDYIPAYITNALEVHLYMWIRVCGDSMFPKIEDGDRILVKRQTSVDSGSVAVVLVDHEDAVVKKVVYGEDWIELQSFNPMYQTRRFEGPDVQRLDVLGRVVEVSKTF